MRGFFVSDLWWLGMFENKKSWLSVVALAVIAYLILKSETLAKFFSAWTILFGALSINEIGVVIGIILGIATYITSLYFKITNQKILKEAAKKGLSIKVTEDER
jgi:uncharacterized protein YqgC (DUF456 family)